MEPEKPTIFVVEDSPVRHSRYQRKLQRFVTIIPATTIEEAETLWEKHKDHVALVVMDGCVPGDHLNTVPLVQIIRTTFQGPIIAASSSTYNREELVKAGCSEGSEIVDVPATIVRLLKISLDNPQ